MFNADDVKLFIRAAIEYERHGCMPTDTEMALEGVACCGECAHEIITSAIEEAL